MPATETDPFHSLIREPRSFAWVWGGYLILYAIAIPWYWPAGYRGTLILGLPTWVAVTLGAVVALALWTNLVIRHCWIDEADGPDPGGPGPGGPDPGGPDPGGPDTSSAQNSDVEQPGGIDG